MNHRENNSEYSLANLSPDAAFLLEKLVEDPSELEKFLERLSVFLVSVASSAAQNDLAFSLAAELTSAGVIEKIPPERLQEVIDGIGGEKASFFLRGLPNHFRSILQGQAIGAGGAAVKDVSNVLPTTEDPSVRASNLFSLPAEAGEVSDKRIASKRDREIFAKGEFVVYPAHGVGRIIGIEEQKIGGFNLELFVVSFEKDRMTLRVPTHKAVEIGMRRLSSPDIVIAAMATLRGKARVKRAMWSRRAKEYEEKLNSGDLLAIAEVVRDLHRTDDQRDQSFKERELYEAALERLTSEVAEIGSLTKVDSALTVSEYLRYGTDG